ncbi:MAG: hypothetical protein MJY95_01390 [Bacteroidaceae bacterium]|nr:hypothetical protein [Bacteroidaceae bacterium]
MTNIIKKIKLGAPMSIGDKGTEENPYTWEEYLYLCEQGSWIEGFVEGCGYLYGIPEVLITASYISSQGPENDKVLTISQFSPYKASEPAGCLIRCREMLNSAGCSNSGGEILMCNYDANGRAMSSSAYFNNGLNYLDSQLALSHPIIVGVDYKNGHSTGSAWQDQATDHFVIIVGGNRSTGYYYYDPATSNRSRGTSDENIFTISNQRLVSSAYCMNSASQYIVVSIRNNN